MMLNLSKYRTVGFLSFITVMLVLNTIPAKAIMPNLDGESRPNRLKLNECIADVKEVTEWDEKQTLAAARDVCKVRQNHAQQKARFLAAQKKLTQEYQNYTNHGFNKHLPMAIEDSWTIVKSCDEERVIVEKNQESLIKSLKDWGFKPIPCSFDSYFPFLGSFHCATLDVRRRGTLQSYF